MLTSLIVACLAVRPCEPEQTAKPVAAAEQAAERAVDYLAREVPRWRPENKCASCHNNGDAARALFQASRDGHELERLAVSNTLDWLTHPERWDENGGEGPFNDRQLADIQFGYALATAIDAGLVKEREPLRTAAQRIAGQQRADGSWQVVPEGTLGAPATYGTMLATALSHATLTDARSAEFDEAVARAADWMGRQRPQTVLDTAALLVAPRFQLAGEQQTHCLGVIRAGAAETGGWGPYVNSPPEPFDTALVLIGLSRIAARQANGADVDGFASHIERGRSYLISAQLSDGSWPETTRPPGAESSAQRMSTTGWVTQALLLTAPPDQ
jgi:hypothetical protein